MVGVGESDCFLRGDLNHQRNPALTPETVVLPGLSVSQTHSFRDGRERPYKINRYRPLPLPAPFRPLFTHAQAHLPRAVLAPECLAASLSWDEQMRFHHRPPLFPWNQTPAWNLPALSSSPGVSRALASAKEAGGGQGWAGVSRINPSVPRKPTDSRVPWPVPQGSAPRPSGQ